MNYEEKYNKLVEAIKVLQETNPSDEGIQNWVHDNVPELAESEGERIRRVIRGWIYTRPASFFDNGISKEEMLAWLEKQCEQKPAVDTIVFIPKFRVGDIVKSKSRPTLSPRKIISIDKQCYWCEDGLGLGFAWESDYEIVEQKPVTWSEDDEKMKLLIKGCVNAADMTPEGKKETFDWLEKQGEQKLQGKSALEAWKDMRFEVYQQASGNRHEPNYSDDTTKMFSLNDIDEIIEKITEQKTTDKVEPKFHEGEWITNGDYTWKILGIKPLDYILQSQDGNIVDDTISYVNEQFHSFTIQDAKDGDVLHSVGFYSDCIFIFNGLDRWRFDEPNGDRAVATGYCCLTLSANNMEFGIQGPDCIEVDTVKPATKKQSTLLFRKMKEAGYEWDAENKSLCTIK